MASKVDWDEYIEARALTELHLIVVGLRYQDLETYIQVHPKELEKDDAMGYAPLWYASIFGELGDVRTLLRYGAILNEHTFQFSDFILRFGSKAFDFLDEHISSGPLRSLFENGCARNWFLTFPNSPLDHDEFLALDEKCFEHGFDVNHKDDERGRTLLIAMLQQPYWLFSRRVKQLFDYGADLELTNIYGEPALHHCIVTHAIGQVTQRYS